MSSARVACSLFCFAKFILSMFCKILYSMILWMHCFVSCCRWGVVVVVVVCVLFALSLSLRHKSHYCRQFLCWSLGRIYCVLPVPVVGGCYYSVCCFPSGRYFLRFVILFYKTECRRRTQKKM